MQNFKTETEQDEYIIGCILASAELRKAEGRAVARGRWGCIPSLAYNAKGNSREVPPSGPCCAVGLGVLYHSTQGIKSGDHPTNVFADHYGVSEQYASGVSDGFEQVRDLVEYYPSDYVRGYQVGMAIAEAFEV